MNKPLPLFDQGTFANLVNLKSENSLDDVWTSPRWVKRQKEFLYESLQGNTPRPHSLHKFSEFFHEPLSIVDFGGGSGWLFHALTTSGINLKSYVNVESIDLHDTCTHIHLAYCYLSPSELENHNWGSDTSVLYFNSVIQYFESDNTIFKITKVIDPETILIDDLTPSTSRQFFAYQKYYESKIPYRFVDQDSLIGEMERRNYHLKAKIAFNRVISPAFTYEFDKEDERFSIGETISLIFQRGQ